MDFEKKIDLAVELVLRGELEAAQSVCFEIKSHTGLTAILAFLFGSIDFKLGEFSSARIHLEKAVQLDPENAEYLKILGDVILRLGRQYRDQGQNDDACNLLRSYCASINHLSFDVTLASWILPVVPNSKSQMADARARYEAAVENLADRNGVVHQDILLQIGTNFMAAYQAVDNHAFQEIIAGFYRRNCPSLSYVAPHLENVPFQRKGKIRIGFVSTNFNNHTVGKLYRGLIAKLDRSIFEVAVFGGGDDEIASFIRKNCEIYFDLPPNLPDARKLIAGACLDILYYADIGMDAITYFLGFARLAHVQCVGWGHGDSTGLDTIDHFISSIDLEEDDPAKAQSHYSENLVRLKLPPTYLYRPQSPPPDAGPDLSFAAGHNIYTCPQALFKILPEFDDILIAILRRDPDGVAIFIEGLPGWSDALKVRWQSIGADVLSRIYFLPRLNQNDFLGLLRDSTVILDTVHFSGGISSAEALSQATPIITWPKSPLLVGRATYAYLKEMGVLDCIAQSAEDYIEKAVHLGTDASWRQDVAEHIRNRSDLLFERPEVIAELESFLISTIPST